MPSPADQLLEIYGASQLEQSFGVSVVLRQNRRDSDAFIATWSDQKYETFGDDGLMTIVQSRDFVFAAADVLMEDVVVEPRQGDLLTAEGSKFQIASIGKLPAVEKLPGDYRWLVHTNKIS